MSLCWSTSDNSPTKNIILKSMQCKILVTWFICAHLSVNMNTLQSKLSGLFWGTFFSPWKKQMALNSHYLRHNSEYQMKTTFPLFNVKEWERFRRKYHFRVKRSAWVSSAQPLFTVAGPRKTETCDKQLQALPQATVSGSAHP